MKAIAKPPPSQQTIQRFEDLQEMFAKTMASLLTILSSLRLNVSEVAMFISNLQIFNDSHKPILVKDLHPQLEEATTIKKLWWIVNKCCRKFQDYDLPRRLVEAYGSPEAKRVMKAFVAKVEGFNSSISVGKYASVCEVVDTEAVAQSDCLVTTKFANPYKTLNDARLVMQRGFSILPYALSLYSGYRSSVWLHWAVPKVAVPQLRRIAHENVEFFIENGIFSMEIDSVKVFDVADVVPMSLLSLYKWGLVDGVKKRIRALNKEVLERELKETDAQGMTLLHRACSDGHTEVCLEIMTAVGANASDLLWKLDTSGRTAIHYACIKQHLELVKWLFQQGKYSVPFAVNKKHDLLHDAMRGSNQVRALEIAKEVVRNSKGNPLKVFSERASFGGLPIPTYSLQETIPVFVMGDSRSGKSTLIRSLQVESYKKQLKYLLTHVRKVDKHRAGIIPTHFESVKFGRMVFFDMAGHREYADDVILQYGHLESALFIIVVNLRDEIVDIVRQLKYWLKFVRYHHSKSRSSDNLKPSIVVIGSHLHSIRFGRAENAERFKYAYHQAVADETYFNFVTSVAMDCRNSTLLLVQLRWMMYYEMWELRARCAIHPLPSGCYILYGILREFCTKQTGYAITVGQLATGLTAKTTPQYHLIDHTVDSLLSLIQPLHMLNVVLLLKDSKDLGESWVVFDCKPLLSDIEQAIFNNADRRAGTVNPPLDHHPGNTEATSAEQKSKSSAERKALTSYIYDEMRSVFYKRKSSYTTISEVVSIPLPPGVPTITVDKAEAVTEELEKKGFVYFESNPATPESKKIKLTKDMDRCSMNSDDPGFSEPSSISETLSMTSRGETASTLSMAGSIATSKGSVEILDEFVPAEVSDEFESGNEGVAYHTGVRSKEEIISYFHQLKNRTHPSDQLMLKLMLHFKFCDRVHWEGPDRTENKYYFFPHLLPNPENLRDHFGKWKRNGRHMLAWVFFPDKEKGKHKFFMPHMIHQLLLEMSKFAFGHQSNQMLHTLWWIDERRGVQVVLNVHDSQAIVLNTRPTRKECELECLKLRNVLAEKIRSFLRKMEGSKQMCIHESLIPCDQRGIVFPMLNLITRDVHFCDLHQVKHAIQNQLPTIGTTRYSIRDLLLFEPYHLIPKDARIHLKKGSEQNTHVSANVFRELTRNMDNTQLGYTIELVQGMASGADSLMADEMKNRHLLSQWVEGLGLNFSQLQQALDSVSVMKLQDVF